MNQYLQEYIRSHFSQPASALDLGAGDRRDVEAMRRTGWRCDGVDKRTGTDLELSYRSPGKQYDLVYSNFVIHKLRHPETLMRTIWDNLANGGHAFILTFDAADPVSSSVLTADTLASMAARVGFSEIEMRVFEHEDTDPGHNHTHKILQCTARKMP